MRLSILSGLWHRREPLRDDVRAAASRMSKAAQDRWKEKRDAMTARLRAELGAAGKIMAQAVTFRGANKRYGPPPGRDDVGTLEVFVNGSCIVSAWEPSPDELAEIVRTGRIFLSSMSGDVLFPAFVGSESVVRSVVVDYGKVWGR